MAIDRWLQSPGTAVSSVFSGCQSMDPVAVAADRRLQSLERLSMDGQLMATSRCRYTARCSSIGVCFRSTSSPVSSCCLLTVEVLVLSSFPVAVLLDMVYLQKRSPVKTVLESTG